MSDDTEGAPIPDALYDLLPPIFRMADIAQSGASVAFTFRGVPFGGSVSSSNSVHATFGSCSTTGTMADFDGDFSANASYLNARALFATCSDPSSAYAPAVFGTRCECYDGNSVNGDGCENDCTLSSPREM